MLCNKCNNLSIWQSDCDAHDILSIEEANQYDVITISFYYCPICDSMHQLWHKSTSTVPVYNCD